MKKGFTLIELIFVIVIIGVLAAVAVPKFQNLKQHAEVNNLLKIITDMQSSVPESYINLSDLEDINITDINQTVDLKGKGWSHVAPTATHRGQYVYNNGGSGNIAVLQLDNNNTLTYTITCANFKDSKSQAECTDRNVTGTSTISW